MLIWTCPTFMAKDLSTPSCVRQFRCNMAGNGWVEIEIATYLKASSNVLSLTSKNLANSNDIVKDEATVDVLGMCLLAFLGRYSRCNKCVLSCLGITIIISAWAISVVHWKTIFLICYLLDYQQVQENSNVSIILLGDKKEPTKWQTNLVQQILLPNNHFPCYFYFKNRFYWRKEKRCVTCLWLPTKANTQI